ncbi:MAG: hypothetical protein M3Z18_02995 [Gemmatimonadota bacterium]|nr:hypothetical protein [Gemmatimonadota bacterium]
MSPLAVSARMSFARRPVNLMVPLMVVASRRPETFSARTFPLTLWARSSPESWDALTEPDTDSRAICLLPPLTSMAPPTVVAEISPCDPLAVTLPETACSLRRVPRGTDTS